MSGRLMERVVDLIASGAALGNGEKLVLFALARWAGKDGSFPSLDTIATLAGMDRRSVIRCLARLTASGRVTVEYGGGRGRSNRYELHLEPEVPPPGETGAQSHPLTHVNGDTESPFSPLNSDTESPFAASQTVTQSHSLPLNGDSTSPFEALNSDSESPDSRSKKERTPLTGGGAPSLRVVASHPAGDEPRRVVEPKGSRLPPDWQPSGDMRLFADGLGLDCRAVADKFRDHWHSQPGAKGRKLDWTATWRNWCREDERRAQRPTAPRQQTRMDRWREMMAEEDEGGPIINGEAFSTIPPRRIGRFTQ